VRYQTGETGRPLRPVAGEGKALLDPVELVVSVGAAALAAMVVNPAPTSTTGAPINSSFRLRLSVMSITSWCLAGSVEPRFSA